jgi:hypothetical protein
MNIKEMATLLEDELQDHVQISIKVVKLGYAVFDVEDDAGNNYVLRLTHVKITDEDDKDDDTDLDEEDSS